MKRQLLALLFLLVVLLAACGENFSPGSQATEVPTRQAIPAPVLGSRLEDFIVRYGGAVQDDIDPTQYVIDTGFLGTGTTYRLTITPGRVSYIWIRIPNPDQSSPTLCWSFRPPDAIFVKLSGSDPNDKIYVSRQLGSKFPASLFQDIGDTGPDQAPLPAPPGTFRVAYEPAPGVDVATCTYWLGE